MRVKAFAEGAPPVISAGVVVVPTAAAEPPPPRSGLAMRPKPKAPVDFCATNQGEAH